MLSDRGASVPVGIWKICECVGLTSFLYGTKLGNWLESELHPAFVNRVIPLGEAEMNEWAALQADAEKKVTGCPWWIA